MHSTLKISLVVAFASALAFSQTSYSNLDIIAGWQSCGSCAGSGGTGPNTPRSLTLSASPSMDGSALKFSIAPTRAYSNALWWKSVTAVTATQFTYDFWIYFNRLTDPQALEFDVMAAGGGRKHTFGTECEPSRHLWKVYGSGAWQASVPCNFNAGQWNHVVWEFSGANGKTTFVSVTVNGNKSYINKSYSAASSSSHYLHPTVQLDGNSSHTAYSLWVDQLQVTAQ